ncbi:hypothetical protein GGI12_005928 [Dipsacomyces acuminosporus]|nr:hypothetical protein GGI12_005928 [Dipsacomyces acuminosporus]
MDHHRPSNAPPYVYTTPKNERVRLRKQEPVKPDWVHDMKFLILYAPENPEEVEKLLYDIRDVFLKEYKAKTRYVQSHQCESIYDMPSQLASLHKSCDILFCMGVVYRDSPTYDEQLLAELTSKLAKYKPRRKLPVFDCILVKDNKEQLDEHFAMLEESNTSYGAIWANRAITAYHSLSKPVYRMPDAFPFKIY